MKEASIILTTQDLSRQERTNEDKQTWVHFPCRKFYFFDPISNHVFVNIQNRIVKVDWLLGSIHSYHWGAYPDTLTFQFATFSNFHKSFIGNVISADHTDKEVISIQQWQLIYSY